MAWSVPDLSAITAELIAIIDNAIAASTIPPFNVTVSGSMPETVRKEGHCQLSLYLLHVGRDPYWRNTPRDNPRALTNPQQALSLNLTYLLTAFSDKDSVTEQQAMSIALHAFHEQPLFHNGGGEEFTISIEADTIDEMSRLWQAIAVPIRLSSVIKVGVVFVAPSLPSPTLSPPPRQANVVVGADLQPGAVPQLFDIATHIDFVVPPPPQPVKAIAGPPVVTGGDTILVGGSSLDQPSGAEVYLGHAPGGPFWQVTTWRQPPLSPNELVLILPATYMAPGTSTPAPPARMPPPGVYQLMVGSAAPLPATAIPIAIAARVSSNVANPAVLTPDGTGLYVVTGDGFTPGATAVALDTVGLAPAAGPDPAAGFFAIDAAGQTISFPPSDIAARSLFSPHPRQRRRVPAELVGGRAMRSATTQDLLIARIRVRARLLARWMERLWAEERSSPDQGLVITAAEVERLLEDPAQTAAAEVRFRATDPACADLAAAVTQADAALAADPCWSGLCDAFGLATAERDFLNLLLAAEIDCGLQRVIAYLHDDARKIQPTPWLAARLFDTTPRGPAPMSALLRWRLAAPIEAASAWWPGSAWHADPAVVLSVAAGHWRDPALDDFAQRVAAAATAALPCLHPRALEQLLTLADPTEIELVGTEGIGRQTLAAQYAAARGLDLLVVDTNALVASGKTPLELAVPVLRMARRSNAIAYWRDAETVPTAVWTQARALGCIVMRGRRQPGPSGHAIMLDALPTRLRHAAWAHWSTAPAPAIVTTQRLTPAEIQRCARAGNGLDTEAMRVTLRRAVPVQSELLTLLPCPYDWDDLVVHADLGRQLREFETQVRLRWSVMEEWGFDRLAHLGHGISALFGGPSGTGKTMAVQVLARALGLDLYRVDLAGVINKYVGETEKRLRDVFDACERAGALLFFDEADALFGSRMQVKEAHDRFANIEIDYLLQRIERFDGVAILATNRKNDLDAAFLRRLRFVVEFLAPRPAERLALWRRALPPSAPSGEVILDDIDWSYLAERLQLTGADIKSAALAAAFLARAEGERIGMRHVLAAAQRELTKHGATMRVRLQEAR